MKRRLTGKVALSAIAVSSTAALGLWSSVATSRPAGSSEPVRPSSVPAKQSERPNVLFVLVDDLGDRDLGYSGSGFDESPNIDAFARHSARFDDAYSSSPVCSPSRAAILTGKNPARLGITTWIPGGEYQNMPLIEPPIPPHLPLQETTIAEAFKGAGYSTFFAGKWHLGGKGYLPSDQGFDVNLGGAEYGQPPHGYYSPYGIPTLKDGPKGEYLDDRLTDETIRFLKSAKTSGRPFFAFLSFYAVHTPIQAPPGDSLRHFQEKAKRMGAARGKGERQEGIGRTKLVQDNATYASMVYRMDYNFGRVTSALRELGLKDNTIIVFTSDNGGLSTLDPAISLYEAGTPTSNEPLRAGKGWTYEGGVRVPLLISGPGIRHTRIGQPVVLTDLYSTLLDLAGVKGPREDSVTLAPLLVRGLRPAQRTLFWHYPHYHGSGSKPASAIRRGDWKLVRNYESDTWELYNLRSDLRERHNVASRNPVLLARLKREFEHELADTDAKLPTRRSQ